MESYRWLLKGFHYVVFVFWGVTVYDVIPSIHGYFNGISIGFLTEIDSTIKILMAGAGFIYYVFNLIHKYRMNREELESKDIENKKAQVEFQTLQWELDEKKN